MLGVLQRTMPVIQPLNDWRIFFIIKLHLNSLKWLHIEKIVAIVKRRLLIIKWRESHSTEMATITLFSTHHNPHSSPLRNENRLNHFGHLIYKGNSSSDVIQDVNISYLLPRHWHILKQFQHGMWHILESTKINSLVVPEFL